MLEVFHGIFIAVVAYVAPVDLLIMNLEPTLGHSVRVGLPLLLIGWLEGWAGGGLTWRLRLFAVVFLFATIAVSLVVASDHGIWLPGFLVMNTLFGGFEATLLVLAGWWLHEKASD